MHRVAGVICRLVLVATAIFMAACYNEFNNPEDPQSEDITTNITTKALSQLLAADGYLDVVDDLRVRGNVTAHDQAGNFYKSFVIESSGYGVEILEGLTDSYVRHELGYEIVVQLSGLRLTRSRGVVQIGVASSSSSYYDVDYLGHEYLVDQHITNTGYCQVVEPMEFTLPQLAANPEYATEICGSLIRVSNLRYYPSDDTEEAIWSGTKRFIDADDPLTDDEPACEIWCYVSTYANFCDMEIPSTTGAITAILQGDDIDGGEGWEMMLKPRSSDDLEF